LGCNWVTLGQVIGVTKFCNYKHFVNYKIISKKYLVKF